MPSTLNTPREVNDDTLAAIRSWLAIRGNTPTLSPELIRHNGREFSHYLAYRIAEMPKRLAEVERKVAAERMKNWKRAMLMRKRHARRKARYRDEAWYRRREEKMRETAERIIARAKTA